MPVSEARKRANAKYTSKAYEQIAVRVKKGKRDLYKQRAEAEGLSLAAYIETALEYYYNRNN